MELHTERLYLRQLEAGDWDLFLTLHTDPSVIQYVCIGPAKPCRRLPAHDAKERGFLRRSGRSLRPDCIHRSVTARIGWSLRWLIRVHSRATDLFG